MVGLTIDCGKETQAELPAYGLKYGCFPCKYHDMRWLERARKKNLY